MAQMNDIASVKEEMINPASERIIISNCLSNPDNIIECESEGLYPQHFGIKANQIIYMSIIYLFTQQMAVDALSIYNSVKDDNAKKEIDDIGGLEYIMLLQQSPKTSNLKMFIKDVLQGHIRRQIYDICLDVQNKMVEGHKDSPSDLIAYANQKVTDIILENTKTDEIYKMGDRLGERLQKIAENPHELPGLEVGWERFDKVTKGAQPGDFIVVCAESKTGKSVTLLNWAKHITIRKKLPILWIDTEQGEAEQEMRLLSSISQVPEDEIEFGIFMEDTEYGKAADKITRIQQAKDLMKSAEFYFVYMPDFTLEKVVALARKYQLTKGIVALFFDYLKLNSQAASSNNHLRSDEKLTFFASGLKEMAGMLGIPVFTANNENRANWGSTEKDARSVGGSLGILQLATKLCFLRNKTDEELALQSAGKGNQKFHIAYQRHGQCPVEIDILFDKIRITQREI